MLKSLKSNSLNQLFFLGAMTFVGASYANDVREIEPAVLIERATKAVSESRPDISAEDVQFNLVTCIDPDDPKTCTAVIEFVVESNETRTIEGEMCRTITRQRTLQVYVDYYDRVIVAPGEGTGSMTTVKRCDHNSPGDTQQPAGLEVPEILADDA